MGGEQPCRKKSTRNHLTVHQRRKITAKILKAALDKAAGRDGQEEKSSRRKGKVNVREQVSRASRACKRAAQITNIVVTDNNIKSFDRVARKYGIDYSLKKVEQEGKSEYLVFFKAKDVDL